MRSNSEEWCIIFSCFKRSSWIQIWTSNVLSGFPHVLWTTCTIMRNTVNWWFSWACSGKIMRNPWNISNSYDQNPRTEGVGKQKHIAKHMKKWRTMYFWFFVYGPVLGRMAAKIGTRKHLAMAIWRASPENGNQNAILVMLKKIIKIPIASNSHLVWSLKNPHEESQ